MRLESIINEKRTFDEDDQRDLDTLRMVLNKRCKEIYKYYRESNDTALVHSIRNVAVLKSNFVHMVNKANRKPTDTPLAAHHFVDQKLYDMFGIKFRSNSLFTYPYNFRTLKTKLKDGDSTLVFPYDGFTMVSAEGVYDLYVAIDQLAMKAIQDKFDPVLVKILRRSATPPDWYRETFLDDFEAFYMWVTAHAIELPDEFDLSRGRLEHTFKLVREEVMDAIYRLVTQKYYLLDSGKDIAAANNLKRQEVMIHASEFVAVNIDFISRALEEKDLEFTLNNALKLLYSQ